VIIRVFYIESGSQCRLLDAVIFDDQNKSVSPSTKGMDFSKVVDRFNTIYGECWRVMEV